MSKLLLSPFCCQWMDHFILWMKQALGRCIILWQWKGKETPERYPSQILLFLSQLKEFQQQTGFAAFLRLAVMTAAVEGMPCLARRASSLKANHQLRRSCGLMEQVWQTTVRFFWMENSAACPERCVVGFFLLLPPAPPSQENILGAAYWWWEW